MQDWIKHKHQLKFPKGPLFWKTVQKQLNGKRKEELDK